MQQNSSMERDVHLLTPREEKQRHVFGRAKLFSRIVSKQAPCPRKSSFSNPSSPHDEEKDSTSLPSEEKEKPRVFFGRNMLFLIFLACF